MRENAVLLCFPVADRFRLDNYTIELPPAIPPCRGPPFRVIGRQYGHSAGREGASPETSGLPVIRPSVLLN
jgi:hypothetical protein